MTTTATAPPTDPYVPPPVGGTGNLNQDPEPACCTCARSGATELDRLDDLMAAGYTQPESCWLLWAAPDRFSVSQRFPHVKRRR